MSKHLEKLISDYKSKGFQEYVLKKLGIEKPLTRRVLQALAEFVALGLRAGHTVRIPGVGRITATKGERVRLTIAGAESLLTAVDKRTDVSLSTYQQELLVKRNKVKQSRKIYEELSGKPLKVLIKNPELIKINFLRYLQRDFVWGKAWQHPYTKEHYSFELIKEKLLALKELNPRSYKALFLLWTCLDKRASRLRYFKLSPSVLELLWTRATDTLMLMLLHPELPPNIVENLTTSPNGRQPRSSDASESSECDGVHRADGATSNGSRRPKRSVPPRRQTRTPSPYWSGEEFVRDD